MNSGQSWRAARKLILFGLLRDKDGSIIGPDSPHYDNLGVGEMIGGPFEDTTGPALNNFAKFVGVFALVTEALYDPEPSQTWMYGFGVVAGSLFLIGFSKFGLTLALNCINNFLRQRQLHRALVSEDDDEEEDDDEHEGGDEEEEAAQALGDG